ncbi:MAG: mitochondrial fission ELM1 family protein [Alphaproteobacteria bacterium]
MMPEEGKTTTPSGLPAQLSCWVVTDGKVGMENQCLGLVEAIGLKPIVKRIRLRSPWRQLSPYLRLGKRYAFSSKGDPIAPPWPDLLVTTGRLSVPAALRVRNASKRHTLCVHIQDPVIDSRRFDLVIIPRHDGTTGPNVMTTRGSLHRVSASMLAAEGEKFRAQFAHLPRPWVAVLIGGANAVYQFSPREMIPLSVQLADLAKNMPASLMVTPSRRTGEANMAVLQAALHDVPNFVWDGTGPNPYYGMLALADYVIVTCDSVNMVSEACSTGKPVYVIDLPGGSEKFNRFHQAIRDDGLARPFKGVLEPFSYQPLNDMELVAARVRQMLQERVAAAA